MRVNPQTGRLEDDNGNPLPMGAAIPMDQVAPQGPPPGMAPGALAANARAGMDLSQPVMLDRGGNDGPPMGLPQQTPVAQPSPVTPQQPPPMVRESGTISHTHEVASPEERRAMAAMRATDQDAIRIAGQQGQLGQEQAQQQLQATQAQAGLRQQQAQETQARIDTGQAEAAAAKAQFDGEREKLSKMDVKDFWSTRTTGQKVAAAISLAMGAVGGVLTGKGGNVAMDVIHKAVDDDYRLQRAQIETQRGKLGDAEKNLHMTNEERARKLSELEVSQTAKWLGVADAAKVRAAEVGTRAAAVQAQVISNGAQEKAQAHYQQWLQGMRDKVTSSGTSVTGTGTTSGEATRAQGKQMEKAALAAQLADDFRNGGDQQLSEAAKARILKNDRLMHAQKDSTLATWLQGMAPGSIVPTNRYDGLTDREKEIANSQRLMAEKAAALNYTAGGEKSLDAMVAEFDPTVPGGNSRQKIENIRNIMNANAGLAGKQMGVAQQGIKTGAAGAPQGRPALSPADRAELETFVRTNPNDPRAARARQLLGL
jgi:hypothetical protein